MAKLIVETNSYQHFLTKCQRTIIRVAARTALAYRRQRAKIAAVIALMLMVSVVGASATARGSGQTLTNSLPPGYPGTDFVVSTGNFLVPIVEHSQQFINLADGVSYQVKDSSFGYTGGLGITPTERVILYSADGHSYIVTEIDPTTHIIYHMTKGVSIQSQVFTSNSANYGGYAAHYCSGTGWFFGTYCNSWSSTMDSYATIQMPNAISQPNGNDACCVFGEWTGVTTDGSGSYLTQGGIEWCGYYACSLTIYPSGFNLFIESPSTSATFFTPPSWMNGVSGGTFGMYTEITANCTAGDGNGGDLWTQFWNDNGWLYWTSQTLYCNDFGQHAMNYGWSIFESPGACGSLSGNYYGQCDIPQFSYNGNALAFSGYICDNNNNCRAINTNYDWVGGWYIQHNSQDTSTSSIAGDGASWTEGYQSSN